ncbi:MAG: hypothetical protein R3F31_27505 [Verrucomicrobiales bacterium]
MIDVNGSASYSKGHIPGAIDFRANKEKLATLLPPIRGHWSLPIAVAPPAVPMLLLPKPLKNLATLM